MIANLSNKLNLLTVNKKLLIIGSIGDDFNIILNKYFKNIEKLDFTNNTFNILNENYFEQYDIVLFFFDENSFPLYKQNYNSIPKNSISIISKEIYFDYWSYLNCGFATLINTVDENTFIFKLFALLSIEETNKLLQSKVKVFNKYKDDEINDDIDLFLEKHIGEIMFINDELNENLSRLKELEISEEIFSNISSNLIKLSNVMKTNEKLIHLSSIFFEFSKFIDKLDLEKIDPTKYNAFDHLTNIIADLTIYIDELFVYRIFKDVRIFEDSMENNIRYFEAKLNGTNNEEDDNLEFF